MNVVFLRMDQIYKEIIKIVPYELIKFLMCLLLLSDVWWYFSKQNIFEYWVNSSSFLFNTVQFPLNFQSIEWNLSGIYIELNANFKEIELNWMKLEDKQQMICYGCLACTNPYERAGYFITKYTRLSRFWCLE